MSTAIKDAEAGTEETTETGPMLMVITLKSGAQIRTRVSEYTVRQYRGGGVAGIRWEATEDTEASPQYVDMAEVAAVHTEWPKA